MRSPLHPTGPPRESRQRNGSPGGGRVPAAARTAAAGHDRAQPHGPTAIALHPGHASQAALQCRAPIAIDAVHHAPIRAACDPVPRAVRRAAGCQARTPPRGRWRHAAAARRKAGAGGGFASASMWTRRNAVSTREAMSADLTPRNTTGKQCSAAPSCSGTAHSSGTPDPRYGPRGAER
jgi:hypothetical protein